MSEPQGLTDNPYFQNFACDVGIIIAQYLFYKLPWVASKWWPSSTSLPVKQFAFYSQFAIFAFANFVYHHLSFGFAEYFTLITTVTLFIIMYRQLSHFWKVGVALADTSVKSGTGYDAALRQCTNSFEFMGIGAKKLTDSTEFEKAIGRCNNSQVPIRLLLLDPNHAQLANAATQQNLATDSYKMLVLDSLRKIAELKTRRSFNIEVRLYSPTLHKIPIFRIVLINGNTCLLSYYVLGEGNGDQLPQLHLDDRVKAGTKYSFYFPFKLYFNEVWEHSKKWDFSMNSLD